MIGAPGYTQSENSEPPEREDNAPWTTVRRRCARSPDIRKEGKPLTIEQQQIRKIIAENRTDEHRKAVQRRRQNSQPRRGSSASNRGEKSSRQKGKTIDPREWGNVNISRESLDIEAQAVALESFRPRDPATGHPEEENPRPMDRSPEVTKGPVKQYAQHSRTTHKRKSYRQSS